MPTYVLKCPAGHQFEHFAPMSDAPRSVPCELCDLEATRDYQAENAQVGMVDGPSSGYYGHDTGWPEDPKNKNKVICPSKDAWKEHIKRSQDTPDARLRDMT